MNPDRGMQNTTVISYYVCEMLPLFIAPVEDSALVFKPLRDQLWPLSLPSTFDALFVSLRTAVESPGPAAVPTSRLTNPIPGQSLKPLMG